VCNVQKLAALIFAIDGIADADIAAKDGRRARRRGKEILDVAIEAGWRGDVDDVEGPVVIVERICDSMDPYDVVRQLGRAARADRALDLGHKVGRWNRVAAQLDDMLRLIEVLNGPQDFGAARKGVTLNTIASRKLVGEDANCRIRTGLWEDGNSSATSNAWTLTQPDWRFC
jgi:hypothetical protein